MAVTEEIQWSATDALRAFAVAESMLQGRSIWTVPDAARGIIEFMSRAERVRLMAEGSTGLPPGDVKNLIVTSVGGATEAELEALPGEVSQGYRAMRRVLTSLYNTSRRVTPDTPTIDVPTVPAAFPVAVIVLTVVGVAAVAGVSWFAAEAVEQKVELEKHRVTVLAQVDLYLKDLAARIAAGVPLPEPPSSVVAAAAADDHAGPILLGTGLLLGGAAVAGLVFAIRKPKAPPIASNPRAARGPAWSRARPELGTSSPRRTNPLRAGYSKATVSKNIAAERRKGKPAPQAVAMSLKKARASYRKAHPKGPFPRHLQRRRRTKNPPADNPRKVIVRSHARKSKRCKHCGRAHTTSQHWSHAKSAKGKGGKGGKYQRVRAAKKSAKRLPRRKTARKARKKK